jgi:hypothetical protein
MGLTLDSYQLKQNGCLTLDVRQLNSRVNPVNILYRFMSVSGWIIKRILVGKAHLNSAVNDFLQV